MLFEAGDDVLGMSAIRENQLKTISQHSSESSTIKAGQTSKGRAGGMPLRTRDSAARRTQVSRTPARMQKIQSGK